jgi:hypothetical protein
LGGVSFMEALSCSNATSPVDSVYYTVGVVYGTVRDSSGRPLGSTRDSTGRLVQWTGIKGQDYEPLAGKWYDSGSGTTDSSGAYRMTLVIGLSPQNRLIRVLVFPRADTGLSAVYYSDTLRLAFRRGDVRPLVYDSVRVDFTVP